MILAARQLSKQVTKGVALHTLLLKYGKLLRFANARMDEVVRPRNMRPKLFARFCFVLAPEFRLNPFPRARHNLVGGSRPRGSPGTVRSPRHLACELRNVTDWAEASLDLDMPANDAPHRFMPDCEEINFGHAVLDS